MAGENVDARREAALNRALELVTEALDLLDAHDGPPDASANLELCLLILRDARHSKSANPRPAAY